MSNRRVYDREGHAHFVTFSCYHRRRLLDHDRSKKIVLGVLTSQLAHRQGRCIGFVVMPDHVHAILWVPEVDQLSPFMQQWKRLTSHTIKRFLIEELTAYGETFDAAGPIWQAGFYDFNLFTDPKIEEKLGYMHQNPVRAGLVDQPCDWPWSSARYYTLGRSVGVPVGWVSWGLLSLRDLDS